MLVMLSLSVSIPGKLKSLLDCGGSRTLDLWFASTMPLSTELLYDSTRFIARFGFDSHRSHISPWGLLRRSKEYEISKLSDF
jgi:hypothetical protein